MYIPILPVEPQYFNPVSVGTSTSPAARTYHNYQGNDTIYHGLKQHIRQGWRVVDNNQECINQMNHNYLHDYASFILTAPLILFMLRHLYKFSGASAMEKDRIYIEEPVFAWETNHNATGRKEIGIYEEKRILGCGLGADGVADPVGDVRHCRGEGLHQRD
jgi:hypothetical protein